QQLIEDFGLTHEEVAARVGRSRVTISNTLRLLQLPPSIQRGLQERKLSMGHARALLGTPDRAFQERLARRIAEEELSVRVVEELVREHQDATGETESGESDDGRRRLRPPGLVELEELLGDHLETRVKITMGSARGKVVVDFSTLEDLERIYRLMTGPT
ncbi:MAG TPA: ParB/RepB/Spo0J family partition protein, partial [Acidimicrobiia bacterium]